MPLFLLEHFDGCSPLSPCLSCRANEYLKAHMSPEDYLAFVRLVESGSQAAKPVVDLDAVIDDVLPNLSTRTSYCLKNNRVNTIRALVEKTEAELLLIPNFGRKGVEEIRGRLADKGLSLAG